LHVRVKQFFWKIFSGSFIAPKLGSTPTLSAWIWFLSTGERCEFLPPVTAGASKIFAHCR